MAFNFIDVGTIGPNVELFQGGVNSGNMGAQYVQYIPINTDANLLTTNQNVLIPEPNAYQYLADITNRGPNGTPFSICGGGLN